MTVSVRRLVELLPADQRPAVKSFVDVAIARTKFARSWRDRKIAHHELAWEMGASGLEEASRKLVADAIEAIHDVIQSVYSLRFTAELERKAPTIPANGAYTLLILMRAGLRCRKERKAAFVRGEFDHPDDDLEPI